jgi:integrase
VEETYLPSVKGRLSPSTYARHKSILGHLCDALGMHRVSDITPAMLEAHRDTRATTLAANSLRLEFARLRQFFKVAVEAGHLSRNPAKAVGLPRETRGPDRILTDEEQARLLAAFWSTTARDMAEFALWTALRPGELRGLTGRMVDLAGARLYLPQPKVERPKVIPLMPEAVAILLRQRPGKPDDPVFVGPYKGQPMRANVYTRAFRAAVAKAGIPPIRPQDLRHTVAVRLIRAGADIATVGDLLGHRPPYRTTARYLAHTNEERKRQVLGRLRNQQNPQQVKTPRRKSPSKSTS